MRECATVYARSLGEIYFLGISYHHKVDKSLEMFDIRNLISKTNMNGCTGYDVYPGKNRRSLDKFDAVACDKDFCHVWICLMYFFYCREAALQQLSLFLGTESFSIHIFEVTQQLHKAEGNRNIITTDFSFFFIDCLL